MTAISALVAACPDCPVGRDARAMAFSDLGSNALFASLPFVVVAVVLYLFVRRIGRREELDHGEA